MSKEPIYGPASFKNWPPKNNKSAVHPHLTKLSKDYKQTDDLQKAVTAFLSIDDGGYDSIEQAFRCGANFGLYHYIKHSPLPEAQPLEGVKSIDQFIEPLFPVTSGINGVGWHQITEDDRQEFRDAFEAYHAQFATDAGGGKEYYEPLTDNILGVGDLSEASMKYAVERGLDSKASINFFHGAQWQEAQQSPSTHSSSEVVSKEWISVEDRLPADNQTVTAKNRHSGQIGKEVVFKDGKFYHEFTSVNSLETTDVEFKNVTEWQAI